MKIRLVFSLFIAALTLLPTLSRADETRWDVLRVYKLADGRGVAVAVPGEWRELNSTWVLEAGAPVRFLDQSGREVQISAVALTRAAETKSVARPENRYKIALRTR